MRTGDGADSVGRSGQQSVMMSFGSEKEGKGLESMRAESVYSQLNQGHRPRRRRPDDVEEKTTQSLDEETMGGGGTAKQGAVSLDGETASGT